MLSCKINFLSYKRDGRSLLPGLLLLALWLSLAGPPGVAQNLSEFRSKAAGLKTLLYLPDTCRREVASRDHHNNHHPHPGSSGVADVVVYNHGYGTTAARAYQGARLAEQLRLAGFQGCLLVPEWQKYPGRRNRDQGRFGQPGNFAILLDDVFRCSPQLQGKRLGRLIILAHSAGFGPAATEIYKNGLADKVYCLALLDSLYDSCLFDPWLASRLNELSCGRKHYYNIFSGTARNSRAQAQRMHSFLAGAGLPDTILEDYNNGRYLLDQAQLRKRGLVFKFSSRRIAPAMGTQPLSEHDSIPALYAGPILAAIQ